MGSSWARAQEKKIIYPKQLWAAVKPTLGKANTQNDYPTHLFHDIDYVNKYFASVSICKNISYST